ncbi:MAG: 4-hydroxy-tetrahydrodipicolinate synthase [Clostridia bacterium]|nr:4-hydroxy-tetrahydrodipicolinate synthase [Clostridia bacterium]
MKKPIFVGAAVAIITPFTEENKINYPKLKELIDYQIDNGTDAVVICGTSGESPCMPHEEHSEAIKFAVDVVGGRVPVIAGTGSNDTAYAIKLSNEAEKYGVDGLLMVTPYYNKTSQAGLVKHYTTVADNVSTPIILYNVPSRTGVTIQPATYQALSEHPMINATKEASGNISLVAETAALCGDALNIYSGNDDQILAITALGGKGVISVLSHVAPKATHDMVMEYLNGNIEKARQLQLEYFDLCKDLFIDVNPIPVKAALNMMGWNVGECRLPLTNLSDQAAAQLRATLAKHNLV